MGQLFKEYQIVATESLGLAHRRLLPTVAKLARKMQVNLNNTLSTLFNTAIETEIEALVQQLVGEQPGTVYTSVDISTTSTLTLAICEDALNQLTDLYFNEPAGASNGVNNTALRLFDRLAKHVAEQSQLLHSDKKSKIVATKKLAPQSIVLQFTLITTDQKIPFKVILNQNIEQTLVKSYLPHPLIDKASIEKSLLSVEVEGYVTMMSRTLKLGDISSLNIGDVISMEMHDHAFFSIGDTTVFRGKISTQNERLLFTVNDQQENDQ
ncbi:hypothetical protein Ping_3591 [Psychromonas ingrahamii 37]|uniref:Flagellar motor switch protein FliN-like C-terminal domain-containing protein n=1 Tax=Psychromonas ingrahamii (strain DSM 17664 / CCUG 51855 / 37) TaxID=357804 RepID=A1T0K9_PSYIN|nr:FliM/FliN family flagellar motor switch protein [Psychromonas ingrahamii]ABM05274.1 hypothetical protein Ping_3591 [Psychromonas ingrahamii 37]